MQVKTITVNATGMATAGRGIQGTGFPVVNQESAENNSMFGPECKVTISQEGRNLSKQQTVCAETSTRSNGSAAAESGQTYRQGEPKGLYDSLTEMYQEIGFTGQQLLDRVNQLYDEIYRRSQGGIQFSRNEPTEEDLAATNELIQKMRKVEDIKVDPSKAQDIIEVAQENGEYGEYVIRTP